jgi:hypothetical protein
MPIGSAMKLISGQSEMIEIKSSHQKKDRKYPSIIKGLQDVTSVLDQVFPISSKQNTKKQTAVAVEKPLSSTKHQHSNQAENLTNTCFSC